MSQIRGRFKKQAHELVQKYTQSISYDWRLYDYDISGSIAHARMLGKQGIITKAESKQIIKALENIRTEIKNGKLDFKPELEDIHMNIEARLVAMIGDVGRKLHTARSRNDQVATDVRMFVMEVGALCMDGLQELQETLVDLAEKHVDTVIPGYTHLQRAQPVLLAHHLLAYFEMFERDFHRFAVSLIHTSVMPLGSGALAGVPYNIDRQAVAEELGFNQISQNSIDAVSDRDFVLEFEFAASLTMMHLSRLAEELVLWSSSEFDFIELDDAFTTGSSIMPQKKNPDVAELARGKTGRVYGYLMALLTTMKGLPLAYNRDMQEDKQGLFFCADTVLTTLVLFAEMLKTLRVKTENTTAAVNKGYILATDIADYLVKKGEPFRTAHENTANLVRYAIEKGKSFSELTLDEYRKFSSRFSKDVFDITVASSIAARDHTGGTAKNQVLKQITRAKIILTEEDEQDTQKG
ncbi:MAG: argininosuccinate lyase [Dehalococcoidia bacterium]|nr:argininosuccinate lyase [Dehalococcoidia bacterium]